MNSLKRAEREETLQITVPSVTKKSLRMKAAESGKTMREVVLESLSSAGIIVPEKELKDRRKGS